MGKANSNTLTGESSRVTFKMENHMVKDLKLGQTAQNIKVTTSMGSSKEKGGMYTRMEVSTQVQL